MSAALPPVRVSRCSLAFSVNLSHSLSLSLSLSVLSALFLFFSLFTKAYSVEVTVSGTRSFRLRFSRIGGYVTLSVHEESA